MTSPQPRARRHGRGRAQRGRDASGDGRIEETTSSPPGAPIFSLDPVADKRGELLSLKSEPEKVLAAVMVGDVRYELPDEQALISQACLDDVDLPGCQAYKQAKADAPAGCEADPDKPGCEELKAAKIQCGRDCYVSSRGNPMEPVQAKNSHICQADCNVGADGGLRLLRFAGMFGSNGLALNVCADDLLESASLQLADFIQTRTVMVCLPMEVFDLSKLTVTVALPGEAPAEVSADGMELFHTAGCGGGQALRFKQALDPEATVTVGYK